MRISPIILRATMALSFALLLTPSASNADDDGKDCTAGNGLYSCDFKDETGTQFFSASLNLTVGQQSPTVIQPEGSPFPLASLSCACGLNGSVDGTKPLKKNKSVLCIAEDFNASSALAGKISGNPKKPANLEFSGQLQQFNGTAILRGYLFDCDRQGNFTK
jgi:hypothetical protein